MSGDLVRKLTALGLTADQMAGVMDIMAEEAEERKEKGRARWRKWKEGQSANVSKQQQTFAANLREGVTRGEDITSNLEISGQKKEKTLSVHSHRESEFELFWTTYPKRDGPNPKKPAKEVFLRLVAKGVDPQRLIAAAADLAKQHPLPTRFVPQAVTWLRQERFDSEDYTPTGNEFCPDDWPNTRFLVSRFRQENQTDPPRAAQGGKAGYLIPAEWVAISKQRVANA